MTNAYAFGNTVATFPYFDKLALKLGVDLIPKSKSFSTATSYFNSNNQNNMTTNGGGTTGTIPHASLANMIGDHNNYIILNRDTDLVLYLYIFSCRRYYI